MSDMFRTLLCSAGAVYLAIRIGALLRALAHSDRLAIPKSTLNDDSDHRSEDRPPEPGSSFIAK